MGRLERQLLSIRAEAVMTVLENQDQWETSNVDVAGGRVTAYEKPATPGRHRFLDYGMLAMRSTTFDKMEPAPASFDLATVIRALVSRRRLLAFPVSRRFYDIGNEESACTTERYLAATRQP